MKNVYLHLACNHHRNGFFDGRVSSVEVEFSSTLEMTIDITCSPLLLDVSGNKLTFGKSKLIIPYTASTMWVGNWCWNAYEVTETDAKRLVRLLARCRHASLDVVSHDNWNAIERFQKWWDRQQEKGNARKS